MGKYWLKIGLRALLIFGCGMLVVGLVRSTKRTVHLSEPRGYLDSLPFFSFQFDGIKAGKFERLVIHRSDPRKLSGVDMTIRIADPDVAAKLAGGCNLTVDDPTRLNNHSSFWCVELDETMEEFGQVHVRDEDVDGDWVEASTVTLLLPKGVAADLRGRANAHAVTNAARRELERQLRQLGDSIGTLGRAMGRAKTAEERDALKEAIDEVRSAIDELNDQMQELNHAAVKSGKMSLEAGGAEVKVGPDGVKVRDGSGTNVEVDAGGVRVKAKPAPKAPVPPTP